MSKGRTPRPPGARESRPGRPPKPEGDKSWLNVPTNVPNTPQALRGDALAEWERLTPYLKALDRIANVDLYPAVAYCFEWGRFCEIMERDLGASSAKLYEDGRNHEVLHPQLEPLLAISKDILLIAGCSVAPRAHAIWKATTVTALTPRSRGSWATVAR